MQWGQSRLEEDRTLLALCFLLAVPGWLYRTTVLSDRFTCAWSPSRDKVKAEFGDI